MEKIEIWLYYFRNKDKFVVCPVTLRRKKIQEGGWENMDEFQEV